MKIGGASGRVVIAESSRSASARISSVESIRFRSARAARRPNDVSRASSLRLEVSAVRASIRRGSADGFASRRVASAAAAITDSGASLG